MKKNILFLSLCILIYLVCIHCGPPKPIIQNEKVIVSHLGELTRNTKFIGDTIKYRIRYKNNGKKTTDIKITDKLDDGLLQPEVFNNGVYFPADKMIIWEIKDVGPFAHGFVEFQAKIGDTDSIINQATIYIGTKDLIEKIDPRKKFDPSDFIKLKPGKKIKNLKKINKITTNSVVTKVCKKPKLGWIPFRKGATLNDVPTLDMKDETSSTITVNFNIPGMFAYELRREGLTFQRLTIPGKGELTDVGKPELPIVGGVIEVPKNVNFTVEIIKSDSIFLDCYHVIPAQEPRPDSNGKDTTGSKEKFKFKIDINTYRKDAYFPEKLAYIKAEDLGIIRGHRLLFLKVNPIQYNPLTWETKVYSQIEVRLKYNEPAQIEPIPQRLRSESFENLIESTILNYKDQSRYGFRPIYKALQDHDVPGCDYLIIAHNDFYVSTDPNNPVIRLSEWKQQKGLRTKIVDVGTIQSGTSADIATYIKTAYDTWNPVPSYILLVGDREFIPTNNGRNHPEHNNTPTATDLNYALVDGNDYFPDIFIGRLSVNTLAQATTIIDKIIDYEKTPPNNANFYTDATVSAIFEDDTDAPNPGPDPEPEDGREDRPWIECSEEIVEFLDNEGYNVDRVYATSSGFPADPFSDIPALYENGTALPNHLQNANGFQWNGSDVDIRNQINNGRFLIYYRDHGSTIGWSGFIGFNTGDFAALANGNLTPLVFSIACETGWFDDDDPAVQPDNSSECFCELFQRLNGGGAVALLGATRISWTGFNDFYAFGLIKAIWPDFVPNPPITGYPAIPNPTVPYLHHLDQINTFGKVFMANAYNNSDARQITFEMYHSFGDPEMEIWTEEPSRFVVNHPEGIGAIGQQDFVVYVRDFTTNNPINTVQVSLTGDGNIIATDQTNPGGFVRFTLNSVGSGNIQITATKVNYRPYEGEIIVSDNGAILNRLDDPDGIENQTVHVGGTNFSGNENVEIYFGNSLVLTQAASGGSFGQVGNDVDIQVPSPYDLGPVNIMLKGQTSNRYAVDVFYVRTANPIDLYLYDQWAESTWHLHDGDNPIWNNPDIQLYDDSNNPVESNNLTVGHNYVIKTNIHNDTYYDANNVKVTFKWANFGVGQPEREWNDIDVDDVDVPRHSIGIAEMPWSPPITGHLCILVEIYHIEDINTGNNKGQENCHVGPTSSPAIVPFLVWNPTDKPAMIHLELRQRFGPEDYEQGTYLWGSFIIHPYPQLLLPGERREAKVVIDPDLAKGKVRPGDRAKFSLTGYINNKIIGGADFIIQKK